MTTYSGRAGLRSVDDAVDRLIDLLKDQFREARAEHNVAAAKMKAEFNAEIAELRGELAQLDATVRQARTEYEKEVATLQRQLAEARAEPNKLQDA
jgi:uncharacterized coiled-coil DUF342 family protein